MNLRLKKKNIAKNDFRRFSSFRSVNFCLSKVKKSAENKKGLRQVVTFHSLFYFPRFFLLSTRFLDIVKIGSKHSAKACTFNARVVKNIFIR